MPNNEVLKEYNSNYHVNAHGGHQRNSKLNAFFAGIAKTRLITIKNNIQVDHTKNYNVLEIGPGPGTFANEWLKENRKSTYYAIETDVSLHENLKKQGIILIDENDIKDYNNNFDIIVISHVLEHVSNPLEFLNSFLFLLQDNGYLFIEVPCKDWEHKDIDEPHLLFFDKKPMIKLAKKLKTEIVYLEYFGTKIKHLKNPLYKLVKKFREKLFYRNINFYHSEKSKLKKLLGSNIEANSLINYSAHIEQDEPSWWLRAIIKK
jgi:SAM-dependent methyltransferase